MREDCPGVCATHDGTRLSAKESIRRVEPRGCRGEPSESNSLKSMTVVQMIP